MEKRLALDLPRIDWCLMHDTERLGISRSVVSVSSALRQITLINPLRDPFGHTLRTSTSSLDLPLFPLEAPSPVRLLITSPDLHTHIAAINRLHELGQFLGAFCMADVVILGTGRSPHIAQGNIFTLSCRWLNLPCLAVDKLQATDFSRVWRNSSCDFFDNTASTPALFRVEAVPWNPASNHVRNVFISEEDCDILLLNRRPKIKIPKPKHGTCSEGL